MGKLIAAIFIVVLGIIALVYAANPYKIYKEESLKSFYENIITAIRSHDCTAIYEAKSDNFKAKNTFDKYVVACQKVIAPYSETIVVNKIWVMGDEGYVDRTRTSCLSVDCTGKNRLVSRLTEKYLFVSGSWVIPDDSNPLNL